MKTLIAGGALFGLMAGQLFAGGLAAAAISDPREMVRDTSDALIVVIEQGKQYYETDPGRFYAAVVRYCKELVDAFRPSAS